jgi:hypothetical protein
MIGFSINFNRDKGNIKEFWENLNPKFNLHIDIGYISVQLRETPETHRKPRRAQILPAAFRETRETAGVNPESGGMTKMAKRMRKSTLDIIIKSKSRRFTCMKLFRAKYPGLARLGKGKQIILRKI